jgi:hypothetical protein
MKAKSILLVGALTLGSFVLPVTTAEAGRRDDYRYVRQSSRAVVVFRPAPRRTYYSEPVRYRRHYNSGPGISVRVNVR